MPRQKLTDLTLSNLKCEDGKRLTLYSDQQLPALNLKVMASGSRSWLIRYRRPKAPKPDEIVLKPDPETGKLLKCAAARDAARAILAAVERGEDPKIDAAEERAKAASGELLVGTVAANWLRWLKANRNERTFASYASSWRTHIEPALAGKRIDLLDRKRDLQPIINRLREDRPGAARHVMKALRSLFAFAVEIEGLLDEDQVTTDKLKSPPTGRRTRCLSNAEIKSYWAGASKLDLKRATFFKLALLLGNRREELQKIEPRQLDLEAGVWVVPSGSQKDTNGYNASSAHVPMPPRKQPLSPLAVELLRAIMPTSPSQRFFGSTVIGTTNSTSKVTGIGLLRDAIDAECAEHGVEPLEHFSLHDLRHSIATGLGDLGIDAHIVETVLAHTSGSIYNHSKYFAQHKAALELWADHVQKITGTNVVPMKRTA